MQRNIINDELPVELVHLILEHVSFQGLYNLALVSQALKWLVDNHIVADNVLEKKAVSFQTLGERKRSLLPVEQEFKTLQQFPASSVLEQVSTTIQFSAGVHNPAGWFMSPLKFFLPKPVSEERRRQENVDKMHALENKLRDEQIVLRKRPG